MSTNIQLSSLTTVREPMRLACRACGATITLDATQQDAILVELTRPAQRRVLECVCGHFQFVLGAAVMETR